MSYENSAGLGVKNFYGARSLNEGVVGGIPTYGSTNELTFDISGKSLNENTDFLRSLLPEGALITKAVAEVKEVFSMGGTGTAIIVGTLGSEIANGINIPEADLEALGTYEYTTFNGTWGAGLLEETDVNIRLAGTAPTTTNDGRVRMTISYTKL